MQEDPMRERHAPAPPLRRPCIQSDKAAPFGGTGRVLVDETRGLDSSSPVHHLRANFALRMIAQAKLTFDEQYYRTFYSDWARHRSNLRKFAPIFATVIMLAGILLLCFATRSRALGIILVAISVAYSIDVLTYGRRWMRRRINAGGSSSVQIDFYEDRIFMKTDRSEGYYQFPGFVEVTLGDQGVFLYPQQDISFYIPWNLIEPAELIPKVRELLISKAKITI